MNKPSSNLPPRLANRMLSWLCKDEWLEPIRGDLYEQFLEDRDQYSARKARCFYWINAFNFLRPFAMKSIKTPSNQFPRFGMVTKPLLRHMKKRPGFYAINILGLTLGLTVVFLAGMWINYHSGFDNFHTKKDRIYEVMTNSGGAASEIKTSHGAVYKIMDEAVDKIPDIQYVTRIISNWRWPSEQCFKIDENKSCIYTKGIFADSSFFKVFDFEILEGAPNPLLNPRQIALSASLGKKLYGDENPIGKTYKMDGHFPVEIVAIFDDLPLNSSLQFDFIAPLEMAASLWGQSIDNWKNYSYLTYVSLNNDKCEKVSALLNSLDTNDDFPNLDFFLHPLLDKHLYDQFENGTIKGGLITYIRIIRIFSIFILVISIVNFINLTTAHASNRGKEIGVRKIIGAGKGTLQAHFLLEIAVSVLISTVLAILTSYLLLPTLSELIGEPIQFQWRLEIFLQTLLILIGTTLLSGLYPAIILSAFKPLSIIKNLQFKASGNHTSRQVLTVLQVSISTFIILMSMVFYHQLQYLQQHDIGYDTKGIMILEPTYQHIKSYEAFKNELLQHPEIEQIGVSNANLINVDFTLDEIHWPGKDEQGKHLFKSIGLDNGLLELMELHPIEGGFFSSDTAHQVILTQAAASVMDVDNLIGSTIKLYDEDRMVVGIIEDFNTESLHEQPIPVILYPVAPKYSGTFYIRYNERQTQASIRIIEDVYDQYEPFFDMKFKLLDSEYQRLYEREKVISKVSWIVMVLAIVIALIGMLGLSIFNVARKLKEIGLRKVFGASGLQLLGLLSKEFVILTVIAYLIALPFTLWFSRSWLSEFAYRIDIPPMVFAGVLFFSLITILGLLALQTVKVSQLNPSKILRDE